MNTIESLPDGAAFLNRLRSEYREWFASRHPIVLARAPGRLDVMGGIADYSGATVCEMPIAEAAFVAMQRRDDDLVCVRTTAEVAANEVTFSLSNLLIDYEAAHRTLSANEDTHWAAYVLGAFPVLTAERGVDFVGGVNILLDSAVPLGKGVSSSAAIEVATLRALAVLERLAISAYELATLAQTMENRVVGAPCGLMDQLTSVFGEAHHLLKIRCQPGGEITALAIPENLHFIGIDSGVRHAVTGASYGDVRVAAFMGYRIIADALDLKLELGDLRPAGADRSNLKFEISDLRQVRADCSNLKFEISDGQQVRIDDPTYRGFLCNIPRARFHSQFLPLLPEQMRGDEFLAQFGGTTDTVTKVDPARDYFVRAATTHPVEEEARVQQFMGLLAGAMNPDSLSALGDLMYQAHASYSRCGLGSEATDAIVAAVREAGTARGLFGAKITGGGSGGTVAVLAFGEAGVATAIEIAATHARNFGINPYIFRGSSPGAAQVEPFLLEY